VLAFEPDLVFSSKIESAARKLGVELALESSLQHLPSRLRDIQPKVLIVNLDALPEITALRELMRDRIFSVIGYYSHVNSALGEEARKAGFDLALTRGAFAARIEEVLQKVTGSTAPQSR
jgi:hypothetical protein